MNGFWVYILKCSDNSYYTGHTDNIEKRISEHKLREFCCYTASRLPVKVVFVQMFNTREAAFNAERKIKGWSRNKKEALIRKDWEKVQQFAKKKF